MKDDKCLRRLNQYSHVKCFHAYFKQYLWEKHLLYVVHFKRASNENSLWIQLVSDKSRAVLIDKTFSKWQCDNRISIAFEIPSKYSVHCVTNGELRPKSIQLYFLFVYLTNLPNINRFRSIALVNGFEISCWCYFFLLSAFLKPKCQLVECKCLHNIYIDCHE